MLEYSAALFFTEYTCFVNANYAPPLPKDSLVSTALPVYN